jgi:hypothetical protein
LTAENSLLWPCWCLYIPSIQLIHLSMVYSRKKYLW